VRSDARVSPPGGLRVGADQHGVDVQDLHPLLTAHVKRIGVEKPPTHRNCSRVRQLIEPDGHLTRWQLRTTQPNRCSANEAEHAQRLASS
jgi:hypothetical protein